MKLWGGVKLWLVFKTVGTFGCCCCCNNQYASEILFQFLFCSCHSYSWCNSAFHTSNRWMCPIKYHRDINGYGYRQKYIKYLYILSHYRVWLDDWNFFRNLKFPRSVCSLNIRYARHAEFLHISSTGFISICENVRIPIINEYTKSQIKWNTSATLSILNCTELSWAELSCVLCYLDFVILLFCVPLSILLTACHIK